MGGKQKEACGRCSVTTVIDATEDKEDGGGENPFDGERIEIEESQMRSVARHEVLASKVTSRLDALASKVIWGK